MKIHLGANTGRFKAIILFLSARGADGRMDIGFIIAMAPYRISCSASLFYVSAMIADGTGQWGCWR